MADNGTLQTLRGSSTGSAVGVAAGFVLVAIGSENNGSLGQPLAVLPGRKVSPGSVDTRGNQQIAHYFDVISVLAKTLGNLANIMSVLQGSKDYPSFLQASLDGVKLESCIRYLSNRKGRRKTFAKKLFCRSNCYMRSYCSPKPPHE